MTVQDEKNQSAKVEEHIKKHGVTRVPAEVSGKKFKQANAEALAIVKAADQRHKEAVAATVTRMVEEVIAKVPMGPADQAPPATSSDPQTRTKKEPKEKKAKEPKTNLSGVLVEKAKDAKLPPSSMSRRVLDGGRKCIVKRPAGPSVSA